MTDEDLDRLAADVLDGRAVDWDALPDITDPATRRQVNSLRTLERIMAASRQTPDASDAPATSVAREKWDGFELREPIGRGVFGEVWRAYDQHLERDVALKLVPAEDDEEARDVLQEGRLLARIRHPNVATVFGATRVDGEIGVAMEFVPGDDLEAHVREHGAMPPSEVLDIGMQLARALEAVHRAGVLHRDVKAANVKRAADGRAILLDFGSSRELRAHAAGSPEESGTPLYLAPEILRGASATVQSDLYSVGVLLFYLLTARYPVEAQSLASLERAHAERAAPRMPTRGVPRRLARFVAAALSDDPARRPRSAARAAAMLGRNPAWARWTAALAIAAMAVGIGALLARDRLLNRGTGNLRQASRLIEWPVPPYVTGMPSRDGRVFPFVDRRNGALALMNVDSGQVAQISAPAELAGGHAVVSAASHDGSTIAYAWYRRDCGCDELRTIAVGAHNAVTLWRAAPGEDLAPTDWSSDGRSIAATIKHVDGTSAVTIVTPPAAPRLVAQGYVGNASFSTDGRYLAFQRSQQLNATAHVWVGDLLTGILIPVAQTEADDRRPVWIRDTLLFQSNRSGDPALWSVEFDRGAGRVIGEPRLLRNDLGGIEPVAATSDGALFYKRGQGTGGVFVGGMNGASPQQRISTGPNGGVSPDWAPDGRTLAWIEEPATEPARHILRIHDLKTGQERAFEGLGSDFRTHMIGVNPRFAPQGGSILVRSAGRGGVRLVDLSTGRESKTLLADRNFGDVEWDRDGRHAYFVDFDRGIARLDLRTGVDELLYKASPDNPVSRGVAVSPDGSRIAFTVATPGRQPALTIMVMDRNGRGVRAIWTERQLQPSLALPLLSAIPLLLGEWTAQGRMVLFAKTETLASGFVRADTELWGISPDGGRPQRLGLTAPGLRDIRPHRDGRRVAYTFSDERTEVWLLRDALHAGLAR